VILKRPGLLLFLMFLATILLTGSFLAGPTATLTGRVTDTSGGVIAGVKVEATNVETNVVFAGETNAEGLYNVPNLPPRHLSSDRAEIEIETSRESRQ
jgi:hypothetical protein